MKKLMILSLAVIFSCQLFGQKMTLSSTWKVKKIGVTLGKDLDMLPTIGDDYFLNASRDLDTEKYSDLTLTSADLVGAVCENPDVSINLTLLPPGLTNVEMNVSLLAMFNRVDGATYETSDWGNTDYQMLRFGSRSNEIALESSLRKRWNAFGFLNFYGGIGTNVGVSYAGRIDVQGENIPTDIQTGNIMGVRILNNNNDAGNTPPQMPSNMYVENQFLDTYEMKNAVHQRLFATAGIGVLFFKRIEIGIEGKYGIGYRYFGGESFTPSILNSLGLTARYVLK